MRPGPLNRIALAGAVLAGFVVPIVYTVATAPPAAASPAIVSLFAGGPGSGPARQVGTDILGIAVHGNSLYAADQTSSVLRSIDLTTDRATVAAGDGFNGFESAGGPALKNSLSQPNGVTTDAIGNLWIADTHNQRVREVVAATNSLNTVAGNGLINYGVDGIQAQGSALSYPTTVAARPNGDFYLADQSNRIRKVTAATGVISTIAGDPGHRDYFGDNGPATAAHLNGPDFLTFDGAGNLYFADRVNGRVRMIDTGGTITTVVGGGINLGEGVAVGQAQIAPGPIAFDATGSVFVTDYGGCRIRKITAGLINTVAGGVGGCTYSGDGLAPLAAGLNGPTGLAFDASDRMYIADGGAVRRVSGGLINRYLGSSSSSTGDGRAATTAQFHTAIPAADALGNTYIPDSYTYTIRKVAPNGVMSTYAGGGVGGEGAIGTAAYLNTPVAATVDPNGNVVVAEQLGNRIRRIDKNTLAVTTIAGTGSSGGVSGDHGAPLAARVPQPTSVTFDAAGNYYIAEPFDCVVRKVTVATNTITTLAGTVGTCGATGDNGPANASTLDRPSGVSADAAGNVVIADTFNDKIRMVSVGGVIRTVAGGGLTALGQDDGLLATDIQLRHPYHAVFKPGGGFYIADTEGARVRVVDPQGIISTVLGQANVLQGPVFGVQGDGGPGVAAYSSGSYGLAIDKDGALLDAEGTRIRRINAASPGGGGRFHAIDPLRSYDSRSGDGKLGQGQSRHHFLAGVPTSATAVAVNITATNGTSASYLTVSPYDGPTPNTSNVLFAPYQTIPNMVIVATGVDGGIEVFNQLGAVDYVIDVLGWFDDGTQGGDLFRSITPTRLLDSRLSTGGWASTPLGDNENRDLQVRNQAGVPATATAVLMNVTVTNGTNASFLSVAPSGSSSVGATSNVLFAPYQTISNLVVSKIGANGKVSIYNQHGSADVVADVMGYFDPTAGGTSFHATTPTRLLDSRTNNGGWAKTPLGQNATKTLTVTGGVIPINATAVVLNTTVTQGTHPSYVAVSPTPGAVPATTSNVLFDLNQTIPNLVVVGVGNGGGVDFYNQSGTIHIVGDAMGYFS